MIGLAPNFIENESQETFLHACIFVMSPTKNQVSNYLEGVIYLIVIFSCAIVTL